MDPIFKLRLDSIVQNMHTNNIFSLLGKGKEEKKAVENEDKSNHYEMNSESQREAEDLFQDQHHLQDNRINKMKDERDNEDPQIKSILKQTKMMEDSDKKSKTVSFYDEGKPLYLIPIDKKWNDKIQNQKKGKFQPFEQKALCDAVGQFLASNDIQYQQFSNLISDGSKGIFRKQKFFKILSAALPERSPESCYKFILRQYHTFNRQGEWSQQEVEQLLGLVDKFGRKWKLIAKQMNRTSDNVYDKYRSLGEEGLQERIKALWKIKELVVLLNQLQNQAKIEFLNPKIKQLLVDEQLHDRQEEKDLKDHKYNSKNFMFHNLVIIRKFINEKQMKTINPETIKWKRIVRQIPTKSTFDCRNKFIQILQVLFRNNHTLDDVLIEFLEGQNVNDQTRINWRQWDSDDYTPEEARNRFMIMKKMIEGRSSKPYPTIVQEIRNKINKQTTQAI